MDDAGLWQAYQAFISTSSRGVDTTISFDQQQQQRQPFFSLTHASTPELQNLVAASDDQLWVLHSGSSPAAADELYGSSEAAASEIMHNWLQVPGQCCYSHNVMPGPPPSTCMQASNSTQSDYMQNPLQLEAQHHLCHHPQQQQQRHSQQIPLPVVPQINGETIDPQARGSNCTGWRRFSPISNVSSGTAATNAAQETLLQQRQATFATGMKSMSSFNPGPYIGTSTNLQCTALAGRCSPNSSIHLQASFEKEGKKVAAAASPAVYMQQPWSSGDDEDAPAAAACSRLEYVSTAAHRQVSKKFFTARSQQSRCSSSSSSCSSMSKAVKKIGPALNTNMKPRARQGSANDPQSIAARVRRERISERLKHLQALIPDGDKMDMVTMLDEAINYVKCLGLQIRMLKDDSLWPKALGPLPGTFHELLELAGPEFVEGAVQSMSKSEVVESNPKASLVEVLEEEEPASPPPSATQIIE
ncbi:unnamed protein product [Sphagnum jensenii]|uniref:BHLH domain-containing protein n=1 Tax=Sphagnum jensenii TaxID=128206 RepID=A0ABP0WGV1_9BRYO